ncbi:hypothetical protein pipiens_010935 [Culex pipiens pipiens]|uniref:Ionotropic receptor n=1 Tax=Culex pipiens pipiens TaxID=38569 RepID=A0ABD1D878_CULPP
MALCGPTLLLVAIAGCLASESYLAELTSYTIAVIQHLSLGQPGGTFECVVVDLQRRNPFDTVLGDVLRSPKLDHVVKFVIGSNFEGDPEQYPRDPSLVLVHAGASYENNATEDLSSMDGVSAYLATRTKSEIFLPIYHFDYNLQRTSYVIMAETLGLLIGALQTSDRNPLQSVLEASHATFVEGGLLDHYTERMKMKYFYHRRKTQPQAENGRTLLGIDDLAPAWIALGEVAKHLNTTSRRVLNPCIKYPLLSECFLLFMSNSFIDVTVDVLFPTLKNSMDLIYLKIPDTHVVLVPRGRTLTVFELFVAPFTTEAWAALLVIIISLELVSFTMPSFFRNDPALLLICGLERYDLHKANRWEKMILLAFIIFFFLITNAYETKIISMMTSKPTLRTVNTIEELVASGMPTKAPFKNLVSSQSKSLPSPE